MKMVERHRTERVPSMAELVQERREARDIILSELRGSVAQWIGRSALYGLVNPKISEIHGAYTWVGLDVDLADLEDSGYIELDSEYVSLSRADFEGPGPDLS